jgi:hypothetical protein
MRSDNRSIIIAAATQADHHLKQDTEKQRNMHSRRQSGGVLMNNAADKWFALAMESPGVWLFRNHLDSPAITDQQSLHFIHVGRGG